MDTPSPKISMMFFGFRKISKCDEPLRLCFALGSMFIGVTPTHLGLPMAFQYTEDSFAFIGIQARRIGFGVWTHIDISRGIGRIFGPCATREHDKITIAAQTSVANSHFPPWWASVAIRAARVCDKTRTLQPARERDRSPQVMQSRPTVIRAAA